MQDFLVNVLINKYYLLLEFTSEYGPKIGNIFLCVRMFVGIILTA